MNKIKTFFAPVLIVCVILPILCLTGCEEQKLSPTEKFFVNDFSDSIDPTDEDKIYSRGVDLQNKTTAQVVAVTVDSTDGEEISDYALNLGREWGIGDKEKNNGVLILLATQDRNIYISVGYGLEGALPDSKTGRMLDTYAIPYLKEDNFSTGMLNIYNAVANEVCLEYGVATDKNYVPAEELPETSYSEDDADFKKVAVSWAVLLVLVVLYTLIFRRKGIIFLPFGGGNYRGGPGGFGGFGGGSSGGFSGGGGSFGGGGAGRGF